MKTAIGLLLITAGLFAGGCQGPDDDGKTRLEIYPSAIEVKLPPAGKDKAPSLPDSAKITSTLTEIIMSDGTVDMARFDTFKFRMVEILRAFSNYGPDVSPAEFGTLSEKMSYWYNVRALWSAYLAAAYGSKMKAYYLSTLQDAFYAIKFPVDGRRMTLKDIDGEIFKLGGYLSLISAPCALSGRAAIPEAAFTPSDFPAIIRARFNDFVADRARFDINVDNMEILVPRIIWMFRDKIMADYQRLYPTPQATLLLALSSMTSDIAKFRLKNAVGYKCVEATARQVLMVTGDQN